MQISILLPKFQLYSGIKHWFRDRIEGCIVQNGRLFGPDSNGGRRIQRQLQAPPPQPTRGNRDPEPAPLPRSRQSRPARIPFEDQKADSTPGFRTSAMSWAILLGGMLLAVAGVVQVSLSSEGETAKPSIAEDVLQKQISQLKAELDKERAERTELTERVAAIKEPAPAPAQTVTRTASTPRPPAAAQKPPPAPAQTVMQTASTTQLPAAAEDPPLPQPMAPSVELLLSDVPLNSIPVSSEIAGSQTSDYGIHLASFADRSMAERGWLLLHRNHSAALGQLKPRIDEAKDDKGNSIFLLLAGPFDTEELATAHCKKINTQVVFCKPRPFVGNEFAATVAQ
jgi:sporulation related protein